MVTTAGTLTVKVQLDASDVPSDLTRAVNQSLKPALAKVESQVDTSVKGIQSSLGKIGDGVGGGKIASGITPELSKAEAAVDQSVKRIQDKLSSIGQGVGGAAGAVGSAGAEAASGFVSGFGGAIAVLGSKAGPVGAALAATVGLGLAAGKVLADSILEGMGQLQDQAVVAAKLGLSPEQMRPLGAAASQAYADGFGESVESNLDTVRAAVQGGLLDPNASAADVEKIVAQLDTVATVTGEDIPAAVRAAQQAITTGLATDATGAFDLITKAQQQGLNVSGDLLDTINEYGTQFRKLGLDGADAFGLIQQAVKGGARDTDVAADAIKEFSIRAIDGSKTTVAAYDTLGLSVAGTTAAFAAGGDTAKAKFQEVIDRIAGVADPAQRAALQVALFGTQSEDLGNALNSMNLGTAAAEFGTVAGAAQQASDTIGNQAAAKWESAKRTIETAANSVKMSLAEVAGPALQKLADWVIANQGPITNFFVGVAKVAIDAGVFITRALGDVLSTAGQFGQVMGDAYGLLLKFMALQADFRGDDAEAAKLRKEAEAAFGFGEGLTAVGNAMKAVDGTDLKRQLDEAAAGATNAATKTDEFGNTVAALPVDGVTVPIAVDTTEANTAMDNLFAQYRTLSVGVELGDVAGEGLLGGTMLGIDAGPIAGTGQSYGLPAGTNTGGYGGPGQDMFPQWVRDLGAQYGVKPSTYPGHQEGSGMNRGIDWVGTVEQMDNFAKALAASKPEGLDQVIWQNPNTGEMTGLTPDGRVVKKGGEYYKDDWAGHRDHVHTAFSGAVAAGGARPSAPSGSADPQAYMPDPVAPPNMPPPVDPGPAPVAAAPAITVAPVEVPIIPQFTDPTDDPVLNQLQAQADAANNAARQAAANKAATAAAQKVADAEAAAETARIARDAVNNSLELKTNEERAAAEKAYQDSLKAITDAQNAQAELLTGQQTDNLNDQIAARKQANAASQTKAEPFDYSSLPLGDPMRIASGAFLGAGGTMEEFAALVGGKPDAAAASATASVLQGAAQPFGAVAGDAIAAAVAPSLIPTGTPTAPDTDTTTLLAERNPAVLGALAGYDVPDYTRQGGDPGEVTRSGGVTASGAITSDTGALVDRTLTNMEAANKARQDQLLAILAQIKQQVATEVLSPIVEAAVAAAMTGIAADMGTAMGETAGPIIGADTAAAVAAANSESSSGTGAIPGMAGGGGIYGGTPGKDSVPAMLMPGEFVLTAADVARMGGFAGVQRLIGGLQANGRIQYFASGGGVGRASTGNPQGGQNVNSSVGADFFGVSQIPVLALAINALTEVLLTLIGVEILQRDAFIEVSKEFKEFRGDFQAFDAAGRIKNDNSGLSDRTSSSEKQAADERLRILKLVINGIVKYVIEKILVPLGKAIGNAIVSALAGAAGGAISGGGGSIAGGIASAAISAAGAVAIDLAAEVFTIAAETFIDIGLEAIGEFLQTIFPNLTTTLLGGAALEQIAGPVSAVMTGAIGVITSGIGNLMGNLGGLFAGILPALQGFLAGFAPLTLTLSSVVGVLSSIAAVLQQIFGGLVSLGASIAAPIVAAVTSVLGGFTSLNVSMAGMTNVLASIAAILQQIFGSLFNLGSGIVSPITSAVSSAVSGFMPLVSNLTTTTNALGGVAQVLTGLAPNLGSVVSSFGVTGAALSTAMGGIATLAGAAVNPPRATVNPVAAAAASTVSTVNQLTAALTAGVIRPNTTTVNAPITVMSATAATPRRIANRLQRLTG